MLKRLRSAIYGAPDLAKAKAFYKALLGQAPYFDQPFYVGFEVGGCELGLDPDGEIAQNAGVYWRVDAIEPVLARVLALGGRHAGEVRDVGGGIKMARFVDPAGNHVGLIEESEAAHA
jgi:predicted enzyme related to lactoylglutathione lyase